MEQTFELPVILKGQELLLPGRLVAYAYTYKIYITLAEGELTLEKDEDGEFRILQEQAAGTTDPILINAILESIRSLSGE